MYILKATYFLFGFFISTESVYSDLIFFNGYRVICIVGMASIAFFLLVKGLIGKEKIVCISWDALLLNSIIMLLILFTLLYHNESLLNKFFFYWFMLVFVFYFFKIKKTFPFFVYGLLFGNLLMIIFGITDFYSRFSPIFSEYSWGPNLFSYFQLIAIMVGFVYLSSSYLKISKLEKIFIYIGLCFALFAVFRSGSRGTLIGIFASLFFCLLKYKRDGYYFIKVFFSCLIMGLFIFLIFLKMPANQELSKLFIQRYSWEMASESGGSGRIDIYKQLLKNIPEDVLWVGYGPSGKYKIAQLNTYSAETHNMYLQILYEYGLITLMIFLFYNIYIFVQYHNRVRNKYDILHVAILVAGFFLHVFTSTETILAYAIICNAYKLDE